MADATKVLPNPFLKPLDIRQALTTPLPPPDHVLPGLLAGTVGMLAGPGGIGKTMLELQLASALAVGVSPLRGALDDWCEGGFVSSPQRVVLVTAEEPEDVLRERLHAVVGELLACGVPGLEADRVLALLEQNLVVFPFTGGPRVTLMDEALEPHPHLRMLEAVCQGARLVILDPLRNFHKTDENDATGADAIVQILRGMSHRTGAAVLFAHHTNRSSGQWGYGGDASAARGSTALTDGVRWQVNLSRPPKERTKGDGAERDQLFALVLLDLAKQNYIGPQDTLQLEHGPGGVLRPVGAVPQVGTGTGVRSSGRATAKRGNGGRS